MLAHKKAVVTGGSSSVGLASAHKLLEWGCASVVIVGRDAVMGEAAAAELRASHPQAQVTFFTADTTIQDHCDRIFAENNEIDIFVHAAGAGIDIEFFAELAPERYQSISDKHFMGLVRCCHGAVRAMKRRNGAIVAISSDAGKVTTPGEVLIGAMKAATFMFVRSFAMEIKRDGIRINSVSPSIILGTKSYVGVMEDPKLKRIFAKAAQRANLGVPDASEVADMVAVLCSQLSRKVTGQNISVNGGISAG